MNYCAVQTCSQEIWLTDAAKFCPQCGTEATPCIRCLCGGFEYNPRTPNQMGKFCSSCGKEFTETYLGQCMAVQLKGLVGAIAEKHAVIPQGVVD